MAILNADHLLEQAERLIVALPVGPPRQVDLRRAISSAYYAVFHCVLTAAADQFVGVNKRSTGRYALVYRSIDHRSLRELCMVIQKQTLSAKYQKYEPTNGFGPNIRPFAAAFVDLYEKRHAADYDPSSRVKAADAGLAIATARSAITLFGLVSSTRRQIFLTLLLFPPR